MIEHFVSTLGANPRVLDAGCGAGRMLPVLADLGCTVEGVDLSEGMIRRARADHPEFPSQVVSLRALPFPDATFAGVFAWYSTIHSPDEDLPAIFGEARRVLRPGGVVLVAFQTGDGVREIGAGFRQRGHDVELDRWHRGVAQMCDVLDAAGFDILAAFERAAINHESDGQAVVIARSRSGL